MSLQVDGEVLFHQKSQFQVRFQKLRTRTYTLHLFGIFSRSTDALLRFYPMAHMLHKS